MRTKTLLLTAALAAAGVVTSVAQTVYSVNAVGYVNLTIPSGFSIIGNPLDAGAGNNTVEKLFASVPEGTTIYKYTGSTFTLNVFDGGWSNPTQAFEPGEGFFIRIPGASAVTVTFVGEVKQGALSNPLPAGFSLKASQVPQSGVLDTVLGFPATDGDTIYLFNATTDQYSLHVYDGGWSTDPIPAVGQGFWVRKLTASSWNRNFSVNQ